MSTCFVDSVARELRGITFIPKIFMKIDTEFATRNGEEPPVGWTPAATAAGRTRKRKLGEMVTERLIRDIQQLALPEGTLLGTEAELLDRYQVSRATLLEAVHQLERYGAARMRRGGHGGLVVANRPVRSVIRIVSTFLELGGATSSEGFEASRILDIYAAQLAAQLADEAAVNRLRQLSEQVNRAETYLELSRSGLRLTNAVAEASGSAAVKLFTNSLVTIISDLFHNSARRDRPVNRGMKTYAKQLADRVEAIASGDVAAQSNLFARNMSSHNQTGNNDQGAFVRDHNLLSRQL